MHGRDWMSSNAPAGRHNARLSIYTRPVDLGKFTGKIARVCKSSSSSRYLFKGSGKLIRESKNRWEIPPDLRIKLRLAGDFARNDNTCRCLPSWAFDVGRSALG